MKLKSFIIPILLVVLLISGCAGATTTTSPSGGLSDGSSDINAKDVFQKVITLQYLADFGILKGAIDPMEGFTRFILLILLFALLFRVLDPLIGRGTAVAVALVISLMTVIFIPGTVLLAAASSYGTLFSLILMLVPVGIAVGAYWFLKDHPWIRVVVLAALLWLLYQMRDYIAGWASGFTTPINTLFGFDISAAGLQQVSGYGNVILGVASWIQVVIYVVWAMLVWDVISALFSSATGHSGKFSSSIKNVAGTMAKEGWNKFQHKAARVEKSALREYLEDKKMLELLGDANETIISFEDHYKKVKTQGGFDDLKDYTEVKPLLNGVKDAIKKAEEEIRPLFRKTKRALKEEARFGEALREAMKNLRTELGKKNYDLDNFERLEKAVITNHQLCKDKLDEAVKVFAAVGFTDAIKQLYSIDLSGAKFPHTFSSKDVQENALDKLNAMVDGAVKVHLLEAKKAEELAAEELNGLIAEAKKLMA